MGMQGLAVRAVLVVAGVGALVWVGRRVAQAVAAPGGYVDQIAAWGSQAATAITPWSPDNVAYQTANRAVQSIPGYEQDTLGTAIHRWLHPEQDDFNSSYYTGTPAPAPAGWSTGGGRYNNPSAYTPPETIVPDYSGAGVWG